MAVADFRSKINLEQKQVQFFEKVYTLKSDQKTGLLIQELLQKNADNTADEKSLKLALGEKQYNELMEELKEAGAKEGCAENYTENMQVIVFGVMSVLYNRPYEEFEKASENVKK